MAVKSRIERYIFAPLIPEKRVNYDKLRKYTDNIGLSYCYEFHAAVLVRANAAYKVK
jgi:hypothetical protein